MLGCEDLSLSLRGESLCFGRLRARMVVQADDTAHTQCGEGEGRDTQIFIKALLLKQTNPG